MHLYKDLVYAEYHRRQGALRRISSMFSSRLRNISYRSVQERVFEAEVNASLLSVLSFCT